MFLFWYGSNNPTQLADRLERNDIEIFPAILPGSLGDVSALREVVQATNKNLRDEV